MLSGKQFFAVPWTLLFVEFGSWQWQDVLVLELLQGGCLEPPLKLCLQRGAWHPAVCWVDRAGFVRVRVVSLMVIPFWPGPE